MSLLSQERCPKSDSFRRWECRRTLLLANYSGDADLKYKISLGLPGFRRGRNFVRQVAAPSILRLALGRSGTPDERQQFSFGFTSEYADMPPLLHGLLGVPDGRNALLRTAQIAWHRHRALATGRSPTEYSDLDGNIFALWTGRPLAFLHIEKCAGSALVAWLARQFHPEQVNFDPHRDLPSHLFTRLGRGRIAQPLIWGHYDIPTVQRMDPERAVLTILREPRARLVSLYHYWRSVDPSKFDPEISFAVGYAHRLSLEDFLNHEDPCLTDNIDNVYVRRLTGFYAYSDSPDRLKTAPQEALGEATEILKKLFYVGITEELERSAARLASRLGIEPPTEPLRSNITEENHKDPSGWFRKISRSAPSRAVQAALDRRTELDRKLYAFARREFELPAEKGRADFFEEKEAKRLL